MTNVTEKREIMNDDIRHRIENNLALVEHIVTRMSAGFPGHIDRDDLVQAGMVALVETAGRYDESRGVAFSTFAGRRIEGAILDVVRRDDWLPRSVRVKARELAAVEQRLVEESTSTPTEAAVAEAADMTPAELSILRSKIRKGIVMALDRPVTNADGSSTLGDMIADDDAVDPLEGLEQTEMKAYIRSAIHLLPERHRLVVVAYFLEGRPMDEIATMLGVTQSRISQIKDDALRRIRGGLDAQYDETPQPTTTRRRDRRRLEYAAAIAADSTPTGRLAGAGSGPR